MNIAKKSSPKTSQESSDLPTSENVAPTTSVPLTLFPGDSLASHGALPASREAQRMLETSGRKCFELLGNSVLDGLLLRMFQTSTQWATSTLRLMIWSPSATKSGRLKFRLRVLEPHTCESESGLWPTPRANDAEKRGDIKIDPRSGLPSAVKMFPTPRAQDGEKMGQGSLGDKQTLLPTPTESMVTMADMVQAQYAGNSGDRPSYQEAKKLWRSPGAALINPSSRVKKLTGRTPEDPQVGLADQVGGQLNPTWVEWLMGYPLGWTDLKDSETP